MRHICIVGLQWGDEGKGKIVDVLTEAVDGVVRYQGGANAGHTVCVGSERFVLHHLPTGILREKTLAILGNGMVIEAAALLREVDTLPRGSIDRIYLSNCAHVVLPHHTERDRAREEGPAGTRIGTTKRGIGPAYEEKYARRGVRVGQLCTPGFIDGELRARLAAERVGAALLEESLETHRELVRRLGARIVDCRRLLADLHDKGARLLFEGAQGSLLDIDFGTYPYVTSSNPSFLGLGSGTGFSPRRIDHVLGVTKAYCTRVGEGPFPSEAREREAAELREKGGEFGSTTGRPRRCGWLDLPALKFALALNDVDSIALTKVDVLCGRPRIPVVVNYRLNGSLLDAFPSDSSQLQRVEPVIEEWPGWREATSAALGPFIERFEAHVARPVSLLSLGRRRDEVAVRQPFAAYMEARR
ncbi:MAG: adenylosuccinate synthase [Planctomycetes bacterium]|nr:adenylosuccinate synthase [Planctomycetota bacterium]